MPVSSTSTNNAAEFDDKKHNCHKRLAEHNECRQKASEPSTLGFPLNSFKIIHLTCFLTEPNIVINYLQNLRSSEELLWEQMEKAKKKEAAFIVNIAKRDQEIAESKMHELAMKLALQKSQNAKLKVTLKVCILLWFSD
nr:FKBP12-interacting protein of 37 kDa isoform X2 [Ipomoea batatas]GMD76757.1 FKBP12-interacting protein of 37 kDa isoform X2 [Ipomoea batatas]GMD79462.1 FKBP12-interacting protein of 37 kDa isoform X2 [Ipomoea batatas]GMD82331.1 FKBP12-interacting protein of 37 kDa isoform X2 [Ipomoea batatas]